MKLSSTNSTLNKNVNKTFGNNFYPSLLKQTIDIIDFNNHNIYENLVYSSSSTSLRPIIGYSFELKDQNPSNHLDSYKTALSGIYLGADTAISKNYRFGNLISFVSNNTNFKSDSWRRDTTYQLNSFGIFSKDSLEIKNNLYLGYSRGDLERKYSFGMIDSKLDGKIQNIYVGLDNHIQKNYQLNKDYILSSKFKLNYTYLVQDKIREKGDYALAIDKYDSNSLKTGVEFGLNKKFKLYKNYDFSLAPFGGYNYNLINPYHTLNATIKDISHDKYALDKYTEDKDEVYYGIKLELSKEKFESYVELKKSTDKENGVNIAVGGKYSW